MGDMTLSAVTLNDEGVNREILALSRQGPVSGAMCWPPVQELGWNGHHMQRKNMAIKLRRETRRNLVFTFCYGRGAKTFAAASSQN